MTKQQKQEFERQKNAKAMGYTAGVSALLLLLFFFTSWKTPEPELPIKEDLVYVDLGELNLGNKEEGMGDIQPLIPGDFAPEQQETAPVKSAPAAPEDAADPLMDDNDDPDAPEIVRQNERRNTPARNIADHQVSNTRTNTPPTNNPPAEPTPAPPKPRAQMTRPNGTGPGGNNSDDYNNSRSQGNGNRFGDQGDPNGSPNGNGTGPRKLTNTHIVNKGILNQEGTSFKGRVTLNLRVDENGTVTAVTGASASPASDASTEAKSFARTIASKIKFQPGAADRTATVVLTFNF